MDYILIAMYIKLLERPNLSQYLETQITLCCVSWFFVTLIHIKQKRSRSWEDYVDNNINLKTCF